jgi:hypothetical protein
MAGPGELHGWQLSDQCSQLQLISINAGTSSDSSVPIPAIGRFDHPTAASKVEQSLGLTTNGQQVGQSRRSWVMG